MKTFYAVVAGYNEYDQHGEYLVSIFSSKPSFDSFKRICQKYLGYDDIDTDLLVNYYNGKGRLDCEDCWLNLIKVNEGDVIMEN